MADNKGNSSNPARGLAAHLDQNRSLQQDRVVGSSSTPPAGTSFRSLPRGPNAATLDAAFAEFTNQPRGTQLGSFPGPANPSTTAPGVLPFRHNASTGWADEFLHHHSQPGSGPGAMAAHLHNGDHLHRSTQNNLNGGQMNPTATNLAWSTGPTQHLYTATHQNRALDFGGFIPATEQYAMYPADRIDDEARLADNAEQAMQAAFAAYDHEFQGAMNGWLKADASGELETHVQNIRMMEEMKIEAPSPANSGLTTNDSSIKSQVLPSTKLAYDKDMMKHANDIVMTLANNGSEETKAKMSGSNFQGLMRAVASGEAAVVDDSFVDTTTGEVIDDLAELSGLKSNQESSDMGNGLHNTDDYTDSKGKGKGKMKTLEEQQQEQRKNEGPA